MTPEEVLEIARQTWPGMPWEIDPPSEHATENVVLGAGAGALLVTISMEEPPLILGTLSDVFFFNEHTSDVRGALITLERKFRRMVDVPPLAEDALAEAEKGAI